MELKKLKPEYFRGGLYYTEAYMKYGCFGVMVKNELKEDEKKVLLRFAIEFERTYTRFLDLQKAESQAREAQIESALERVRTRTMAMQQSSDLHEVIKVVTDQLSELGIKFNVANFAKIHSEGSWDLWISTPEQSYPALVHVPYLNHGLFNNLIEIISKGVDSWLMCMIRKRKIFFSNIFLKTPWRKTPLKKENDL